MEPTFAIFSDSKDVPRSRKMGIDKKNGQNSKMAHFSNICTRKALRIGGVYCDLHVNRGHIDNQKNYPHFVASGVHRQWICLWSERIFSSKWKHHFILLLELQFVSVVRVLWLVLKSASTNADRNPWISSASILSHVNGSNSEGYSEYYTKRFPIAIKITDELCKLVNKWQALK